MLAALGLRQPRPEEEATGSMTAVALLLVAAVTVPAVAQGSTASLPVSAADLTVSTHEAPFPEYVDDPGGGGGGGNCNGKANEPGCP